MPTASTTAMPAASSTAPSVQTDVPVVKAKRVMSEKQRNNYPAANARRVQILADAKILRVAEATEKAKEKAALAEYATAMRLAHKYGFTVPNQSNQSNHFNQPYLPYPPPPTPSVSDHGASVRAAEFVTPSAPQTPPPIRYYERPPTSIRYV
ncbi:hypothetical protein T492DRAFT_1126455 [Pavlovales sp. CCMP2436]|nr:hypothetical protein T492DRAFT_1126455 [Pavlovales sp. CCMP2436]